MNGSIRRLGRWVVVTKERHFDFISKALPNAELTEKLPEGHGLQLVTFGSGIIIPKENLQYWDGTINFHGASPDYPGRDPHHWAAYEDARSFGATAHAIWPKVDSGPICGQLILGVTPPVSPKLYAEIGETALYALFQAWCSQTTGFSFEAGITWSGITRKRQDLIDLCDMRGVTKNEKERRKRAFQGFEKYFLE
ncbi:formyltransferase family protein [Alphaproteobacteria bacterium]|jgi:hypothetical protein|nr:formyltransferase family protein [Alphaproteobacteria bacterium]